MSKPHLILASQSKARQDMLRAAGLYFDVIPADIDEVSIMDALEKEGASAGNIALRLAKEKAKLISEKNSESYIIGSDQVLFMNDKLYTKAKDKKSAVARLMEFQGQEHFLTSAVSVYKGGKQKYHRVDVASLKMKPLDVQTIDKYSELAGDVLTNCVGCYALEGIGIRLFQDIRGDYFTILGMPLLPLLNFLDTQGFDL